VTDSPTAIAQFTATTNAAVGQAQQVAQQAVAQIDAGTFGCEAWCQSLLNFFNIVAQGSATHFQTAISQPCCGTSPAQETPSCGMQPSDPISVPADNEFSRQLSVAAPFTRVGGQLSIPNSMIGFQTDVGSKPDVLAAGATSFAVYLRDAQYIGASYTGTVRLSRITNNLASAGYADVVVTVEL
jgi:hypothetical protein